MTIDYSLLSKKTQKRGMQVINANPNIVGSKSNISKPKSKPKLKYRDSKNNPTNLKTANYYKGGGNVLTCR